jgi:catechol 2,3-dioxygenase-like lactoylglutathione lyase family enzyme
MQNILKITGLICLSICVSCQQVSGQTDSTLDDGRPEVRGIYNWIHSTGYGERAFAFYRDMLGLELARSPFGGPAPVDAPPPQIRPASEARSDPLIWHLTDSEGGRFRNIFMHSANTPYGLELSEFYDIPRRERVDSPYDPGSSRIIFYVRDLETLYDNLRAVNTPVVNLNSAIVNTSLGESVLIRDPDGYMIQLVQASATEIATAAYPEQIISTHIGLTVADTTRSLLYYQDLLGFEVEGTRQGTAADLQVNGLSAGSLSQTTMIIPGTDTMVILDDYQVPAGTTPAPRALSWTIQDVGSPQFQLQVSDIDAFIELTLDAGYEFLSWDAEPIQRNFGRFVFAIDPDGVLVEYVEPTIQN